MSTCEQFVSQWGLKPPGMWLIAFGWVALDVLKDRCAFIFRVKQFHTLCPVKTKALYTPETSVITHPTTQRRIPEDVSPQQHCFENLRLFFNLCDCVLNRPQQTCASWRSNRVRAWALRCWNVVFKHGSCSLTFIHVWFEHNKNEINCHLFKY